MAAILGIIILLAAAVMPMVFAFGKGEAAAGMFRASLAVAVMLPVLAYGMFLVYRLLKKKGETPSGTYRNIVFDVGQVLMRFDWEGYLDSYGFPEEKRDAIARSVFLSPIWGERDRGAFSEEEYIKQFVNLAPELENEIRKVVEDSDQSLTQMDYAQAWTAYLKSKGYRLYVLSNYGKVSLDKTRGKMNFLKNMDGAVFSCDVKVIKPEPEIYRILLDRYSLDPAQTVFLDDSEKNCAAARKLGITAIHFKNLQQAEEELRKLGIE